MAKQDCFAAKNEQMFIYGLSKQNYLSVMEEVHCSIDCEKGRTDQKSWSSTAYSLTIFPIAAALIASGGILSQR